MTDSRSQRLIADLHRIDPGLANLKKGLHGLLSIVVASGAVWTYQRGNPETLPPAAIALAGLTALFATVAVPPQQRERELRDALIVAFVACGLIVVIGWLRPLTGNFGLATQIALPFVIFAAFALRGLGPTGLSAGMLLFLMFSAVITLPYPSGAEPWLASAALFGGVVAATIRRMLHPGASDAAMADRVARLRQIAADLIDIATARISGDRTARRIDMGAAIAALRELQIAATGIPDRETGKSTGLAPLGGTIVGLTRLILAVDSLAVAISALTPDDTLRGAGHLGRMQRSLGRLRAMVLDGRATEADRTQEITHLIEDAAQAVAAEAAPDPETQARLLAVLAALHRVAESFETPPDTLTVRILPFDDPKAPRCEGRRLPPHLRLACQGFVGAALLTALGLGAGIYGHIDIDPHHWAALTLFIALQNSVGASLLRVSDRLIGTLVGVILAIGATHFLPGGVMVVLFAFCFVGVFVTTRIRYDIAAALITFLVIGILNMMSPMTPEAMLMRLTETILGAAVAGLVALTVFPYRALQDAGQILGQYWRGAAEFARALASGPAESLPDIVDPALRLNQRLPEMMQEARLRGSDRDRLTAAAELTLVHARAMASLRHAIAAARADGGDIAPSTARLLTELADQTDAIARCYSESGKQPNAAPPLPVPGTRPLWSLPDPLVRAEPDLLSKIGAETADRALALIEADGSARRVARILRLAEPQPA